MKRALAGLALAACSSSSPAPRAHDAGAVAFDAADTAPAYKDALRRGRQLAKRGDHAAAIGAFREALVARPDDPRALSELSWAALGANDPALAKETAQYSIDRASDPKVQAASLYNLGRAEEELGNRAAAIDAYRRSLALRPSRAVERRLRTLNPARAAWADAPLPLLGPFAQLDAFCAELGIASVDEIDDAWCAPTPAAIASSTLPAPFTAIARLQHADAGAPVDDLALRTAAGWWVLPDAGLADAVEVAGARILVRTRVDDARFVTVCGSGSSGAPSCLGPLLVEAPGGPAYDAVLRAGDILSISARVPDPDADLAGEHHLVFP